MRKQADRADLDGGELAELVLVEQRLAARLAGARREAAALVAAAHAEAERARSSASAATVETIATLRRRGARARRRKVLLAQRACRRRRRHWEDVAAERLQQLARSLVGELVAELCAGEVAAPGGTP